MTLQCQRVNNGVSINKGLHDFRYGDVFDNLKFNEAACSGFPCTTDYYEEDLQSGVPPNYAPGQEFTFTNQTVAARDYAIKAVVEPGY